MTNGEPPLQPQILATKLSPPRVSGTLIQRENLLLKLKESAGALVLISAPAGFGKTTLAAMFAGSLQLPYAWLSLDPDDNVLDNFVAYLAAAMNRAYPGSAHKTQRHLGSDALMTSNRLADLFIQDLADIGDHVVLFVDDYHFITNLEIHEFVARVLDWLPPTSRIVLISRSDPPLPLSRLRGRRQVTEVRSQQLKFSDSEAAAFAETAIGPAIDTELIDTLVERTEGWPAGLAILSMAFLESWAKDRSASDLFQDSHRLVTEYLLDEVMAGIQEPERSILMRASMFDRFSAPLLQAVSADITSNLDCQSIVDDLWRSNLFVAGLDSEGKWYRFHALFRDFLESRLRRQENSEAIDGMYLRACEWFEHENLLEEGIVCALKTEEPARAARMVERHAHTLVNLSQWSRLQNWLDMLPEDFFGRPGILVPAAYLAHARQRGRKVNALIEKAITALDETDWNYSTDERAALNGQILALRSQFLSWLRAPDLAIPQGEAALQLLPTEYPAARSLAEMAIFHARSKMESRSDVAADIQRAILDEAALGPTIRAMRLQLELCALYYDEAHVESLRAAINALQAMVDARESLFYRGYVNFGLGWVHYQENDLARAVSYFLDVWDDRESCHVRAVIDSMTGLYIIYQATGKRQDATSVVRRLSRFVRQADSDLGVLVADSLAWRLAHEVDGTIPPDHFSTDTQLQLQLWEVPAFTSIRAHIRRRSPESHVIAAKLLTTLQEQVRSDPRPRHVIDINLLEVLLQNAWGDKNSALELLAETVALAAHGSAIRKIADFSPDLLPLLSSLQMNGPAQKFVQDVIAAAGASVAVKQVHEATGITSASPMALGLPHKADLTPRELDVLLLLSERLTDKEIAARLVVSPRTVHKHTANIFQKLDVKNRRQAVAVAQQMGLLT